MRAMVFAAGLGTRLRPLTNNRPKALVEVDGKPMLERVADSLRNTGVTHLIINVHHFADKVIEFVRSKNNFGMEVAFSDETSLLLDTGGGLKKAEWFFGDDQPFFLHNVDIFSDLDLKAMCQAHQESDAMVTLAINRREGSRFFLFDSNLHLCGWENIQTSEKKIICCGAREPERWAFCGVHVISPRLFPLITEQGVFSIVDVYLRLCSANRILGFPHRGKIWMDLGKKEKIEIAENILRQKS